MANEEQLEYWNGEAGALWAERDDVMAKLLQPVAGRIRLKQANAKAMCRVRAVIMLELSRDFPLVDARELGPKHQIHLVADESHGGIAKANIASTRVL